MRIPPIGLYVVGDEILSGLREDKHVPRVIACLKQRGLSLSWVKMIGDDRSYLASELARSFATDHIVFSCGGIGGTPDDHTRQAAAMALNVPIVRHAEAVELIRERCEVTNQPLNEPRLRMADFPQGAVLIPNPYNRIAGFTVGQHHFVPGFPVMAWPMIEWVLDTIYPHFHHQNTELKQAMRLFKIPEAAITPVMEKIEAEFPGCRLYSLPSVGDDKMARHIELGVKTNLEQGGRQRLKEAFQATLNEIIQLGCPYELIDTAPDNSKG